jgi:hypothetical protein
MRHTTTALIALTIALSACSNTDDTAPPPTPTPSPAATTTATAPTPPVMPRAARAHTEAGAKAFVEYFWDVVNYAQATGDTNQLADLSADGCTGCDAGIASIKHVYADGGQIIGGRSELSNFSIAIMRKGGTDFASSSYTNTIDAQTSDYPGTRRDTHSSGRTFRDRLALIAPGQTSWRVAAFEVTS